jgi:hypothetical protein
MTLARCTSMSHPANVYPESGLIFTPPLCWVACGGVLWFRLYTPPSLRRLPLPVDLAAFP